MVKREREKAELILSVLKQSLNCLYLIVVVRTQNSIHRSQLVLLILVDSAISESKGL